MVLRKIKILGRTCCSKKK